MSVSLHRFGQNFLRYLEKIRVFLAHSGVQYAERGASLRPIRTRHKDTPGSVASALIVRGQQRLANAVVHRPYLRRTVFHKTVEVGKLTEAVESTE